MTSIVKFMGTAAKFIASITGAVAVAISEGVLTGSAQHWVSATLAIATAIVVYFVPNTPAIPIP